ncbi:MAG: CPBP family glutamic-type intramembrane protease [Actinomycetota bacterium]
MRGNAPAPGWYPDPGGRHEDRYWDGSAWTLGISDRGVVAEDPLPLPDQARPPPGPRPPETRPALPSGAAGLAAFGILAGSVLGLGASVEVARLDLPTRAFRLIAGQAGLWSALLTVCLVASRRYGTGNAWRDLAARAEWRDAGRGFVVSLIGRVGVAVLLVPLVLIDRRLVPTDLGPLAVLRDDPPALLALGLVAILGAPLVEELFFRGLLMRSLQSAMSARAAIAVQAGAFGLVHASPLYGLRNVSLIATTALLGVLLGVVAERYRRLAPGMFAHGFFNLLSTLVIAFA